MSKLRTLFRILRIVGLVAILALLLRSEWQFIHGHLPHILNLKIQFFAVASLLLVPVFWALLVITIVSHIGKLMIDKQMQKAEAVE